MTLAIRTLRLAAFRSYAQARLDVAPGIVALAGPNGAGKTNVLEAISMLSPGRGLRRAQPGDLARKPAAIGWSLTAQIDTACDPVEIWTGADEAGRRTARLDGKSSPVLALGRVARVLWLTPALDRVFVEGPGERRRLLDRMTLSLAPEHAEAASRYDRAMRERNRLLRDEIDDPRWLSALEAQMALHGVAVGQARRNTLHVLRAAQPEGDSAFPRAEIALDGTFEAILDAQDPTAHFSETLAASRGRDRQAGRALDGPHRSDLAVRYAAKDAPAADCSTGEQKALLVSLILANARALTTESGSAPILLLDEIAAHFDAGRRAALFAEIAALKAQAWLTGTEWSLFAALPADAQRLTVSETAEGSRIDAG